MCVGAMMTGAHNENGRSSNSRRSDDFYPTPPDATLALVRAERKSLTGFKKIWDPACGDGAILKVFEREGWSVVGTDLVDRGYGLGGQDFLKWKSVINDEMAIITNPPFVLARDFIEQCHAVRSRYTAMLLKATYWHAAERRALFYCLKPSRIYPLSWRLDFLEQGRPTMECMWIVWDASHTHDQCYYMDPLSKPLGFDLGAE